MSASKPLLPALHGWKGLSSTASGSTGVVEREGGPSAVGAGGQGNCFEPARKPESSRPEEALLLGDVWVNDARDRTSGLLKAPCPARAERGVGRAGGLPRAREALFVPLEEGVLGV